MSLHQGQPILTAGAPLTQAAMVMIHGRGASAESILELAREFQQPTFSYLAPQAAGGTWYPNRFIMPLETNEPYLSSALQAVGEVVASIEKQGIPAEKIMLLGFSQGACLALEYAARHAKRYGGVVALSGGLIGETLEPSRYQAAFDGTPIFLGCSDVDFHVPLERVQASSQLLEQLGASVTERIYKNMGHTVNMDEIQMVRQMMSALTA